MSGNVKVYFSEKPPSLERLEAKLLSPLALRGSAGVLLPELLRRLRLRELGRLLGSAAGVWSSNLNLAVAVTLVTCPPEPELFVL